MEIHRIISKIHQKISETENLGQIADYIPELQKVDENKFGVHIRYIKSDCGVGDFREKFSIQSIAKIFSLCLAYQILGDKMWRRVGVEPSGTAFNSLVQLETDHGIPRNPFINAGAIVVCDILISELKDTKKEFITYLRQISKLPYLDYSYKIAKSEESSGYHNIALCNYLKALGNIKNDTYEVLDFYFHLCSIEMCCEELTNSLMFLAKREYQIGTRHNLSLSQIKRINAIMQTCGFYDESGEFAFRVGLPGKSGVGGGIVAIKPLSYCIAVWSPKLNEKGNSRRGMLFLEEFTTETESSIF